MAMQNLEQPLVGQDQVNQNQQEMWYTIDLIEYMYYRQLQHKNLVDLSDHW